MEQKIKSILVVGGAFDSGGVESIMMNIIRNLYCQCKFSVVAMRSGEGKYDSELISLGVKILKISPLSEIGYFAQRRQLLSVMKSEDFDIVHINGTQSSILILQAARACGIPVRVFHAHNTQDSMLNRLPAFFRKALQKGMSFQICHMATQYLACGMQAGRFVFGEKKIEKNAVRIIHNSVDLNKYHVVSRAEAMACKESLLGTVNDNVIVLGNAGRFTKVKNQLFAIQLTEQLCRNGMSSILCLAGAGGEQNACREYVKAHRIEDKVRFLGEISDIDRFYKSLDVFLLPSLYEGLPVTLIEAQACGVPVMMSDTVTSECDMGVGLLYNAPLNDMLVWENVVPSLAGKRVYDEDSDSESIGRVMQVQYSINNLVNNMIDVYR